MDVRQQIESHIAGLLEPKRGDMEMLHRIITQMRPDCRLWFLDGRNDAGKIVSNPSIGYGCRTIAYADGTSREFYQVGMSANTSGISVYIMGVADRDYLSQAFGARIGKASVTGYCIRFKALKDVDVGVLEEAIGFGFEGSD